MALSPPRRAIRPIGIRLILMHSETSVVDRIQYLLARGLARLPPRVHLGLCGAPAVEIDGETLDPMVQLVSALRLRRGVPGLVEPTYAAGRARYRRDTLAYCGPRTAVGTVLDFEIPGPFGRLRVRHYAPLAGGRQPLLVYFHGGGFVLGDLDTHDEPCRMLCHHADTHVLSVEYRLAPENPFPSGVEDARAALAWALANAEALGADPGRVGAGGDSAGGNLAAVATWLAASDGAPPAAQLLIYPPTDSVNVRASHALFGAGFFLTRRDRAAFGAHYAGSSGIRGDDPRLSPLLAPNLDKLPPTLVVTAAFDLLRDEGEAYAVALERAGVTVRAQRVRGLGHGFLHMTGVVPAARRAFIDVAHSWRSLLDDVGSR